MPYGICITLFFNNEVHDPVFKFLYFILFSITVFNWFTDLIGAHWDITLFLLRDGVRGANKMLAYICHLLYMWACTWYWYLQQGLKCFLFLSLQVRGLDIGCFTRTAASTARSSETLLHGLVIWWKPMNKFVTLLLSLSPKYSTQWRAA